MIYENDRPTLSHGQIASDGEGIAFRIERGDGESMDLACTMDDISDMFHYLASLAREAGVARDIPPPPVPKTHNELTPIPAEGMGLQLGPGPDEMMLLIRLSGFDMAFAFPSNELARLLAERAQTAAILSADRTRPN
jgi:hypothetical protein